MSSQITHSPKVFISYSWDSPEHMDSVLALADRLRSDGIDCSLDQYEVSPPESWSLWMERQIQEADFVLMICTETYKRRVEGEESPGKGQGVRWEGHLSYQDLYNAGTLNTKIIPVLLESGKLEHIPKLLRSTTYYLAHTEEGYEALYRRLTNQPRTRKPELGKLKELPPRDHKQDFSNQEPRLEPGTSKASVGRKVFFSFHYQRDIVRVNVVRNCAISKGGYEAAGFWEESLWETVKKEGDLVIKRMINQALQRTSVTIVLIGTETAEQRWVQYELEQSYERGNGMLGIYIHNIPNLKGQKDTKGTNPFSSIYTTSNGELVSLANLYPTYDWVADDGYNNFTKWVESAAKTARK